MDRHCIFCDKEIEECMGFVLARDIVDKRIPMREYCGECIPEIDLIRLLEDIDNEV